MEITESIYVKTKKEWRSWLLKNHKKKKEIWLIYYKKASGKERIPYNDSVDEALCFGWIDGIAKPIDDEKYAQRFTPRRKGSNLSQLNKERIRRLIEEKRMTKAGLDAIAHAFNAKTDVPHDFKIQSDILKAIKADKDAWTNFQKFPAHYKRIRIAAIEHVRTRSEEEFKKRLSYFVKMTSQNRMFGMLK